MIEKGPKHPLNLFARNPQDGNWVSIRHLDEPNTVNDVSWANQMGRTFHLIGAADTIGAKFWRFTILKDLQVEVLEVIIVE
jgi:hypothetical protein